MGLLIGARSADQPVILSGGSQMIAVILLALEFLDVKNKDDFVQDVFIATTGWLVKDNSLNDLLNLINERYDVHLLGLASPLNFKSSIFKELTDYELGHVKEGVGAGGISILKKLLQLANNIKLPIIMTKEMLNMRSRLYLMPDFLLLFSSFIEYI